MYWVIFISCGMMDVWAFGPMFPTFYPFLGLGVACAKALPSPCFFFLVSVCLLAIDLAISLYRACYSFSSLLISCYPVDLRAYAPTMPAHFFINLLLRASLANFSYIYLFWGLLAKFLLCQPISLFRFRTSLTHLFFLYLFYSHGLFARSFGLPWLNYYILTSYYFLDLLAFKPTQ